LYTPRKISRSAENKMEYTTDETETPMSTQGTSRITREFTDKKKINKAQDSLLLFMPAITF